jgi:threonine/homoserine/homoserine lactone efflux protein
VLAADDEAATVDQYVPFVLAYLVPAATPGVEAAAIVATVLSYGRRTVAPLGAGLLTSKVLLMVVALAGLTAISPVVAHVAGALKYVGAAWLTYLAARRLRSRRTQVADPAATGAPSSGWSRFALGATLTLSNPLAIMFYVAVLPSVTPHGRPGASTWIVLPLLALTIMGTVIATYTAAAHALRQRLADDSPWIDRTAAVVLLVAAALLLVR